MCGRYSLGKTDLIEWSRLGVGPPARLDARWNIAPGSDVLVIRHGAKGREAAMLRWGLIPSWAKDPGIGHRMVNARAESAHERPAFSSAFASRRCLLPADGFYEWQVVQGRKKKQPWRIEAKDGSILALGGLWESWRDPGGEARETCTILTVPVSTALAHIHDRMPVIIADVDSDRWLDARASVDDARGLCRPAPGALLDAWPISLAINEPTSDGPTVAERAVS